MSRIGKKPITVPKGVTIETKENVVTVKGPKGTLERTLNPLVQVKVEGDQVTVVPTDPNHRDAKAMHGLSRTLVANMLQGVVEPFKRVLEISGVGYRAELKGKVLNLQVGLSHEVNFDVPEDITCKVDKQVTVHLESANKESVGQFAAKIRGVRPSEPYKGKGIKYQGERVRRKEGKTGSK